MGKLMSQTTRAEKDEKRAKSDAIGRGFADLTVLLIVDVAAEHLPSPDLIRLDGIAGHSAGAIYCGTPFHVRVRVAG
jgi:hypothetical protein